METFPTLSRKVNQWLKAGVLDNGVFAETEAGTPQGGVLSPLLANVALHGLEEHIRSHFPARITVRESADRREMNWKPTVIRYADDLVVLHRDRGAIEECRHLMQEWLAGVGLELNEKKTRIAHTLDKEGGEAGFNFLGFNIRQHRVSKYNTSSGSGFKTLIKPSREAIKRHGEKVAEIVRGNKAARQDNLIGLLNPVIAGWANYYSAVVSKRVFNVLDHRLFEKLRRWAFFRHPRKGRQWVIRRYWRVDSGNGWIFEAKDGLTLNQHSNVPISRHAKVQGEASPFDGNWSYWAARRGQYPGIPRRLASLLKKQQGRCEACGLYWRPEDLIEIHHLDGDHDNNRYVNLAAVHRHCHDQIHGDRHELSGRLGTHDKRPVN
jgi:RNA-directed DNA polymerase